MEDLLVRLVEAPTTLGDEDAGQAIMAAAFADCGLEPVDVPLDAEALRAAEGASPFSWDVGGKRDVIATWETDAPDEDARSLILNGHVDVVPPGDEALWSDSPWSGAISDGKLYGRGACDMKSGVATGIFAVAALQSLGFRPAKDVLIESVIGEESGGVGTLTTIVKGYSADGCIVLEPTGLLLCPVQSGALTFRLTVPGRAAHAALRQHGVSAIEKFCLLLNRLSRLEAERHERYQSDLYDDPRFAAPISIGTVRGGEWHSTVAERVVAEGRMGVFPGESIAAARHTLERAIAAAAADDPWLRDHPPLVEWFEGQFESGATDPAHPLVQTLASAHGAVLGQVPAMRGVPYGADLRLFTNHANIPTVLYGAGDVSLAHGADEHIVLDDVVEAVIIIALAIVRWCGPA